MLCNPLVVISTSTVASFQVVPIPRPLPTSLCTRCPSREVQDHALHLNKHLRLRRGNVAEIPSDAPERHQHESAAWCWGRHENEPRPTCRRVVRQNHSSAPSDTVISKKKVSYLNRSYNVVQRLCGVISKFTPIGKPTTAGDFDVLVSTLGFSRKRCRMPSARELQVSSSKCASSGGSSLFQVFCSSCAMVRVATRVFRRGGGQPKSK